MKKYWIYACILLLSLRVALVPLFFPFGTSGFAMHAIAALILIILAISWITGGGKAKGITIVLFCVLALDFVFYVISKTSIYGEFPYYPRYALLTAPVLFTIWAVNSKVRNQ